MEASTSNGSDDVKTFRGRSLEELLPQIRAELGPDAIVLRRREGLGGGVGGFFQRPYVEVDARAPQSGERPLEIRSDRATIEGLSSPAVQALFEQATPFADALAAAARETRTEEDTFSAAMFGGEATRQAAPPPHPDHPTSTEPRRARETAEFMPSDDPFDEPSASGLYGPQPNAAGDRSCGEAGAGPAPTGSRRRASRAPPRVRRRRRASSRPPAARRGAAERRHAAGRRRRRTLRRDAWPTPRFAGRRRLRLWTPGPPRRPRPPPRHAPPRRPRSRSRPRPSSRSSRPPRASSARRPPTPPRQRLITAGLSAGARRRRRRRGRRRTGFRSRRRATSRS